MIATAPRHTLGATLHLSRSPCDEVGFPFFSVVLKCLILASALDVPDSTLHLFGNPCEEKGFPCKSHARSILGSYFRLCYVLLLLWDTGAHAASGDYSFGWPCAKSHLLGFFTLQKFRQV